MRKVPYIGLLLLISGFFASDCLTSAYAQPDDSEFVYQPSDTVFNEILLTDESVVAVDTAGYGWYYDFKKGSFVVGNLPVGDVDGRSQRRDELGTDEVPVEERCTEEKEVKPFERRSVWVGYDEYVDGDIIAYGRVTIKGWVKGDVKSIRKRVLVTESGRVDGNIEAPEIIDRGIVLGEKIETGSPLEIEDITRSFSASGVIIVISFTVFLLFCGFLAVTLMPKQMANFGRCLSRHKVKSFFLGLLFVFLMPAVLAVVMVTIIGLIVVPFVPLIYLIAFALGIVSFANLIGKHFSLRYLGGGKSMLFQSTVGILLLMSFWFVVAVLLGSNDDVSQGFGVFFLVVSIMLSSFPILAGVGAAILTRFGFKEYVSWKDRQEQQGGAPAPTPAPPPIPEAPSPGAPPAGPVPPSATPPPSPRIPKHEE